MRRNQGFSSSFYLITSVVLMLASLLGGIILVKRNQDNRNLATVCSAGQEICQHNPQGKNTGYLCKCLIDIGIDDWRCSTPDLVKCPTDSGGVDPSAGVCSDFGEIVGRCIKAKPGKTLPLMWKYKCPGRTDLAGGCQENGQAIPAGSSSVCFDNNFCGSQQIDAPVWQQCYISVVDRCDTATSIPPTPTIVLSPTPTPLPPNCVSLIPVAGVNLNNLQVGKSYSFKLTASGTVTNIEMSAHGASCSDDLRPYAPVSGGPGTYTFTWTPTTAGPFTLYGRVWNDSILECRADCVDQLPKILCANASSCKLTGKSVSITSTLTPTKGPTSTLTPRSTSTPTPRSTSTPTPRSTSTPTPRSTSTPRPTSTPTGTLVPTPTLTSTPIPSNTPTGTLAPTNTPTNALQPTDTPVYTAASTSTPIPTEVLAQGPSPTRIILPQSGVEFPLQILTVLGAIVTLVGFLILL